jgi:hypothetical protein
VALGLGFPSHSGGTAPDSHRLPSWGLEANLESHTPNCDDRSLASGKDPVKSNPRPRRAGFLADKNIIADHNTYALPAGSTLVNWLGKSYADLGALPKALGWEKNGVQQPRSPHAARRRLRRQPGQERPQGGADAPAALPRRVADVGPRLGGTTPALFATRRIDGIFLSPDFPRPDETYVVSSWLARFASDHRSVVAVVRLP